MIYVQPRLGPGEWDAQISQGFWHTNESPNPSQTNRFSNNPKKKKKKKRTCRIVDFAVPAGHRVKLKENKKKDKYLDLARELKKTAVHESGGNCNWCSWYSPQRMDTGTGGLRNKRMSEDHPNYYIIENGQNPEDSPGDLGRLAFT